MIPRYYARAMAARAATGLLETQAVEGADSERLAHILEAALWEELTVESRLTEEAQQLISAHKQAVRVQGADVEALRQKIVAKLARERGVVLR